MTPLLQIENVSFARQGRTLLDNVTLDIADDEIVTLIGPNGAGKTTLVNIILGLLKPDTGHIRKREQMRFGYMPQKLHIDHTLPLNVIRFLQLADRNRALCTEAMSLTGISGMENRSVHQLSGGEIQRLLLTRAILRKPDLLVLDEPVQGVDVRGQEELYSLIAKLKRSLACSILMVSHDLHLVMRSTDRVICLNHHVCCHGSPDTVSVDPAFTTLFGARTAPYSHDHDHRHDMHGDVVDPCNGNHHHG
ncbi:MAG: metal ABC transporter ATP-binding protein [bacterium]